MSTKLRDLALAHPAAFGIAACTAMLEALAEGDTKRIAVLADACLPLPMCECECECAFEYDGGRAVMPHCKLHGAEFARRIAEVEANR